MLSRIAKPKLTYSYSYGSKRDKPIIRVKVLLIYAIIITLLSLFLIYWSIPTFKAKDEEDLLWSTSTDPDLALTVTGMTSFLDSEVIPDLIFQNKSSKKYESTRTSCKIPKLDPFESTIMHSVFSDKTDDWKITCGKTTVFWTDHNWNLFRSNSSKVKQLACCYRVVYPQEKPNPNSYSNHFTYKHIDPTLLASYTSSCVEIISDVTKIPNNYEYISIECHKKENYSNQDKNFTRQGKNNTTNDPGENKIIVHRDMFAFVPLKHQSGKKINRAVNITTGVNDTASPYLIKNEKKPNILIIGLDQISNMQFIRHFPQSYEYLTTRLGAKIMLGYNKVADTTLPNVVPLLTGLHLDELSQSCWNHSFLSFFDSCPFIWKNFSSMGFLTSYAEDKVPYSIFYNTLYARRGFRYQPTDYFYNFLGMQQHQNITSRLYCTNNRLQYEDVLQYVQRTAKSLKNHSYFQFVWASSLFTKEFNLARNGDQPLLATLESLKNHLQRNTILFIVSDHGYRFSPLIELQQGRAESKLPLFLATFPKWFTQKYQKAIENFETNANRLTTAFDAFETLKDLLDPDLNLLEGSLTLRQNNLKNRNANSDKSKTENKLPRGISMFLPIPPERTCDSAGIQESFCICRETKALKFYDKSEIISKFKTKIIHEINSLVSNSSDCMKMKLNKGYRSEAKIVISPDELNSIVNMSAPENDRYKYFILQENIPGHFEKAVHPRLKELITSGGNFTEILVTIQTIPGLGLFEGRLKLEGEKWRVKDVLRLNRYNDESYCVRLYKLKSFCYCRKQKLIYLN